MIKLCFFISFFMFTSCAQQSQSHKLAPEEFHQHLQKSGQPILLDVRTPEEFETGRLPNAANIDFYEDHFKEKLGELDKEKPIFVYCHSGNRSEKAANVLNKLGFKEVYELEGGIEAWESEGLEVEK